MPQSSARGKMRAPYTLPCPGSEIGHICNVRGICVPPGALPVWVEIIFLFRCENIFLDALKNDRTSKKIQNILNLIQNI